MDDKARFSPRVDGARGSEMRRRMQASVDAQDCDFCNFIGGLPSRHTSPIILEGVHWVATSNDFPYPGTDSHLLILSRYHVMDLSELPHDALTEFLPFCLSVTEELGLTGYCPFARIGDPDLTAQTMPHLHFHITQSDGKLVDPSDIDPYYRWVIEQLPDGIARDPNRLKRLGEAISMLRSILEGKARGIYPKLSNEAKQR